MKFILIVFHILQINKSKQKSTNPNSATILDVEYLNQTYRNIKLGYPKLKKNMCFDVFGLIKHLAIN